MSRGWPPPPPAAKIAEDLGRCSRHGPEIEQCVEACLDERSEVLSCAEEKILVARQVVMAAVRWAPAASTSHPLNPVAYTCHSDQAAATISQSKIFPPDGEIPVLYAGAYVQAEARAAEAVLAAADRVHVQVRIVLKADAAHHMRRLCIQILVCGLCK